MKCKKYTKFTKRKEWKKIMIYYLKHPLEIIIYIINKFKIKISDETFLKLAFLSRQGYRLNLKKPETFNEKIQWLKLYDRKPEYTTMVDKYEVKKYVANIIGEEYIIPTLGVWDKFEDINFENLPNQFVLKCTHDSGSVIICKDKNKLNISDVKKKINKSLKKNFYYISREWPYKNVKPRIIAEKYMKLKEQASLIDYKFFCFYGEPKFLYISEGLDNHELAKISFCDMEYCIAKFHRKDYKQFDKLPQKPVCFEEMKELARCLSKDIPFIRVDFYEIEDKIYFGELTFYPCSGYIPFEPKDYDKVLGDMIKLPKERVENEK